MYDYFYTEDTTKFSYFVTPKFLFEEEFKDLDALAKILYGILLDTNSLSLKNKWVDKSGRVFIYMSRENVAEKLRIGKNKATELFKQLSEFKLIEEQRQGLGRPNRIYVKNFTKILPSPTESTDSLKQGIKTPEIRESRIPKSGNQDSLKQGTNNTNINNTKKKDTEYSLSGEKNNKSKELLNNYVQSYLKVYGNDYIVSKNDLSNCLKLLEKYPNINNWKDIFIELFEDKCMKSKSLNTLLSDRVNILTSGFYLRTIERMDSGSILGFEVGEDKIGW